MLRFLFGRYKLSSNCGFFTGARVDLQTGEVRAGAVWCKSWHCEHCAPIRQKQLMAQAAQGEPNKFITLTSKYRPDEMSAHAAAQELVHAWRMVIQKAKRHGLFKNIQYIAVFELTQRGWPHLHILARCPFFPQAWLSKQMDKYCSSPIVDIRSIKSKKRAAWYVAKYTAKAPEKFDRCKRYWRTHKYDLSDSRLERPVHDFYKGVFYWCGIEDIAAVYDAQGYLLEWDSDHSFTAIPTSFDMHGRSRHEFFKRRSRPYEEASQCISH